jgi:hypothetical protein
VGMSVFWASISAIVDSNEGNVAPLHTNNLS